MHTLRWLFSWVAWVFGPLVLTGYYVALRLRNAGVAYGQTGHRDGQVYLVIVKPQSRWLFGDGQTFGHRIFIRGTRLTDDGLEHELTHVIQYQRLGWWGFLATWARDWARYGYADIPLENEARAQAAAHHH